MNLQRLRSEALAFRTAIEKCDKKRLGVEFEAFPRGSSAAVTQLLGKYLIDQGFGEFRYVSGARCRANEFQHECRAWLQQGATFVDITADPFAEAYGPVVVTMDSSRHDALKGQQESNARDERTLKSPFATFGLIH